MSKKFESIIRRYKEEVWSKGNMSLAKELLTPDFVFHSPNQAIEGREAVVNYLTGLRTIFPDLHFDIHEIILEADRAACVWNLTGTQQHEFFGFPAQGQQVELPGVSIIRLAEGRLSQEQVFWDRQRLLEQLQSEAEPV